MDEVRKVFVNNLQYIMNQKQKNQSDIVRALGVNSANVSAWYNGTRYPRPETMQKIARFLGCTVADLTTPRQETAVRAVQIPVFGSVAAGVPLDMIVDVDDWEEIDEHTASTGKFFGLKIKGNSMEPRICDGDVVIVRQQDDAESGDTVIVTVNGDTATCKRIRKYRDGIELIPNNPAYEPMFYNEEEIENLPVKVIGKVIELRGKV